jgi:DNA repair exonuclease SbcCD ATPase subunit
MIILQKLAWDNCFSYGKGNEIDFTKSTLTQLVGTNGVGKSSIPLILEEILFNKNSKNVKKADIANRYINNGYTITLWFTVDSDEYCIAVDRKSTLKCKLTKNGEDISSHTASNTYKTLGDILGIDFKTFTQLVYQNTNASLQFLTATDTNRKKFLIDLLKLDDYVLFFETFKEAVRVTSLDIAKLDAKSQTLVKWLNDNKLENTDVLPMLELPSGSEEDQKTLSILQAEFENISNTNKKINTNNSLKEQLKSIDIDKMKKAIELYPTEVDTSPLSSELGEIRYQLSENQRKLQEWTDIGETPQCPTCRQDINMELVGEKCDFYVIEVGKIAGKLDKLKEKLEEQDYANKVHRTAAKRIQEWESLFRSIDTQLPTTVINKDDLEGQIQELRSKIAAVRSSIQEVSDENNRRTSHNTRLSIIQEQTASFETELEEITDGLSKCEDVLSTLEILKKAFSTNGLLAYKIESLVKELESLTNDYLAEFSDGRFAINFVVENDKLNVEVSDNGKIIDILALSSGELARVNIATLVAIRKLMSSISRSQINVLFLDEVNQALDETGKEKVVEVLLKEDSLNTYMVSHGWTHPLLEKIEIIKEDNISRLDAE